MAKVSRISVDVTKTDVVQALLYALTPIKDMDAWKLQAAAESIRHERDADQQPIAEMLDRLALVGEKLRRE